MRSICLWILLSPLSVACAKDPMLLELELNDERVSRGALVYPLETGCRVEAKELRERLLPSQGSEWLEFTNDRLTCEIDERLGVARLTAAPSELKTRLLNIAKRVEPIRRQPSESSLAVDFIANRNGLRTGLIASHASSQLSLSFHPSGHLEHWTGTWNRDNGLRLELGSITAPLRLSGAPQSFEGIRLASHRDALSAMGSARAQLTLQNPSRIRLINSNAQELLGLTPLPAGPYRIVGPTGSTVPGFLRVLIEGPDGAVSEQILPWTHHPQLLEPRTLRWEVSTHAKGALFGTLGWGLRDQDSLWLSASTDEHAAQLEWVTSRLPTALLSSSLRLECRSHCRILGGASFQAGVSQGGHLYGAWHTATGFQATFTGAIGARANLALSVAHRHRQAQLSWTLTPRSRLNFSWTETPIGRALSLQWHFNLGSSQSLALHQRREGREVQVSQNPQKPGALGWSIRASEAQVDLSAHQQHPWGDWHAQIVRSEGHALTIRPQASTRLWITEQGLHLGPVGDYNLVKIDTGINGLELTDQQGWSVKADARGVAAFSRVPAHTPSRFQVSSRGLSLSQTMPFDQLVIQTDRRRAYRLIKRAEPSNLMAYRLTLADRSDGIRLFDALNQPVFVSPDGYIDVQSHHQWPLSLRTPESVVACRFKTEVGTKAIASEQWVQCKGR